MQLVPLVRAGEKPRVGLLLADGRVLDLQAAHMLVHGRPSPHLQTMTAFRLSAALGAELVQELARAAPASALVAV